MNTIANTAAHTAAPAPKAAARRPENARTLAAFLLAAAVAALAVAVDGLVDTLAEGHLLATWVALWAVVFAGSLLLAGTARRTAGRTMEALNAWARRRAELRAEARFLALAATDERVMSDLRVAQTRAEQTADVTNFQNALAPLGLESGNAWLVQPAANVADSLQNWRKYTRHCY